VAARCETRRCGTLLSPLSSDQRLSRHLSLVAGPSAGQQPGPCDFPPLVPALWKNERDALYRDIAPGEELTNGYALFNLASHEEFDCRCGSLACRGRVDSREAEAIRPKLERRMWAALPLACRVAQPLWPLLSEESAARISAKRGPGLLRSAGYRP
jgi:hypothetical protein